MITHEPECVTLKRKGAEHVARLLSGKSRQEELEFWRARTERLRSQQKQGKPSIERDNAPYGA